MDKHAFLIIAHKDDYTFRTLLKLLDDKRNDIFIHMDRKLSLYDPLAVEKTCKHSSVVHVERTSVSWGGYSQINAELILLNEATKKGRYLFYHLLSGEDLPIKTQDYIHLFFSHYPKDNFIRYQSETFEYGDRVYYNHFFNEHCDHGEGDKLWDLSKKLLGYQKRFNLRRNRGINFKKGTNWFSITDELARYVVARKKQIHKTYIFSFCADEVFLQTLVYNSPFRESLHDKKFDGSWYANMRLIDWSKPDLIWRAADLKKIKESDFLFARKFNCKVDSEIIKAVEDIVGKKKR